MKSNYIWSLLAFLIFGLALYGILQQAWSRSERSKDEAVAVAVITGYTKNGVANYYVYMFVVGDDTCHGVLNSDVILKGCEFGDIQCLGRRFAVRYSASNCSNSELDLATEYPSDTGPDL